MNFGEAAMFLAVGFIPTLIVLEMVYPNGLSDWKAWRYFLTSTAQWQAE
jgi:hypothetical protein